MAYRNDDGGGGDASGFDFDADAARLPTGSIHIDTITIDYPTSYDGGGGGNGVGPIASHGDILPARDWPGANGGQPRIKLLLLPSNCG